MTKGRRHWRYMLDDLIEVFTTKRAPCEGSTWSHLREWVRENRLRMPKWYIDVYGERSHEQASIPGFEYLLSIHNLNWFEARKVIKLMQYSDRQLRFEKELHTLYPWYLHRYG
ncbi:hypothetical protein SEA_CECE_181 [Microbacterium phage Cece]|nr:hypothetical protein SEA_CECE_181 [Microbacterium phage Cece]